MKARIGPLGKLDCLCWQTTGFVSVLGVGWYWAFLSCYWRSPRHIHTVKLIPCSLKQAIGNLLPSALPIPWPKQSRDPHSTSNLDWTGQLLCKSTSMLLLDWAWACPFETSNRPKQSRFLSGTSNLCLKEPHSTGREPGCSGQAIDVGVEEVR